MSMVNPNQLNDSTCRCILHVDMDAFYTSVEQRDRPDLKGKPVIVGSPPDKRGVVSAASYEARRFGVHSAMPSRTAYALCPDGIFLPVDMSNYQDVSKQLMSILESFTPWIEPLSVDEAFLDITGLSGAQAHPDHIAMEIRQTIREQLHLTASVGVAPNKYLAKLSSDMDKPDGLTIVPFDSPGILRFLAPLPVGRMWGVGKKAEARLASASIRTMADVQALPAQTLAHLLKSKAMGKHVWALSHGIDDRPVMTSRKPKSISNEHTYDVDCNDPDLLRRTMIELTEQVGRRLRKAGFLAETGRIKVRSSDFSTVNRQRRFERATDLDHDLLACSLSLLEKAKAHGPVRLLGFAVSGLMDKSTEGRTEQMGLFDKETGHRDTTKNRRLDKAVDRLRRKFGNQAIRRGG